ncbi:1-(5-phosphoribosyl)-5-[(5-phosphoribosylamino)methylideneamino] imidazole-4-carboxamide isomerase [Candidatus Tremblaya princeps]|uniref:1-(5-phosphoribosyl)-5-[(5-phosphoribosylamino)methylideneamino] imidazole-4-carboxamide isomerase n=1 Tax=Tremblaya princeps TaxID=189385 RepID=A0A143WNP2_TREPR|nr:1-(5-phosphoribosyl)-5-[(5-phosphoribosylamino)methylideneamino] imidazole-4-carboxamide isomerase [Candidatus Tremblaya princeps]
MCKLPEMAPVGYLMPAIDVRCGYCTRLRRGSPASPTIVRALRCEAARLARLRPRSVHIVDLDGAMGSPRFGVAGRVCRGIATHGQAIQVGGGARSLRAVEYYLRSGAARVALGTRAMLRPWFLLAACAEFPGRVALAQDVRHGAALTHGWLRRSGVPIRRCAALLNHGGQVHSAVTQASSDGTMHGIEAPRIPGDLPAGATPAFVGGGLSCAEELAGLLGAGRAVVAGVICGSAAYGGHVPLRLPLTARMCRAD